MFAQKKSIFYLNNFAFPSKQSVTSDLLFKCISFCRR